MFFLTAFLAPMVAMVAMVAIILDTKDILSIVESSSQSDNVLLTLFLSVTI